MNYCEQCDTELDSCLNSLTACNDCKKLLCIACWCFKMNKSNENVYCVDCVIKE